MEDDFTEIAENDNIFNYKFLIDDRKKGTKVINLDSVKVGEKDFEPDHTKYQEDRIQEAQDTLYDILSTEITLHEKKLLEGVYVPERQQTIILNIKGNFFRDFGFTDGGFNGRPITVLNKLELLYLLERGSIVIYLNSEKFLHYLRGFISKFNMNELYQLNLQHFYSFLNSFELKKYQVFSHIKRLGYLVQEYKLFKQIKPLENHTIWNNIVRGFFYKSKIYDIGFQDFKHQHNISYNAILRNLIFIRSYRSFESLEHELTSDLKIHFNVWKPRMKFSKKSLPIPDFHICVTDEVPKIRDIHYLFNQLNYDYNDIYQLHNYKQYRHDSLKTGTGRSIILAVLDNGINFVTLSEVDFQQRFNGKITGMIH